MEKIKAFIFKYTYYIIGALFLLFIFKSCQSSSANRRLQFSEKQHNEIIASLSNKIDSLQKLTDLKDAKILSDSLLITNLKEQISNLKDDKKHMMNINKQTTNTVNTLLKEKSKESQN